MLISQYQSIRRRCYHGLIAACFLMLSISAFGESEKPQYVFDTFTLENIKDADDTLGNITVNFSYITGQEVPTPALHKARLQNTFIKVIADKKVFLNIFRDGYDSKKHKAIKNEIINNYNSSRTIDDLNISLQINPTREIQQALQSNKPIPLTNAAIRKQIDNYRAQLDLQEQLYQIKAKAYENKLFELEKLLRKSHQFCTKQE